MYLGIMKDIKMLHSREMPCARNAVIKFWKNNDLFFMVHPYSVDMILIHCINLILFHGSLHLLTMGYVSQ